VLAPDGGLNLSGKVPFVKCRNIDGLTLQGTYASSDPNRKGYYENQADARSTGHPEIGRQREHEAAISRFLGKRPSLVFVTTGVGIPVRESDDKFTWIWDNRIRSGRLAQVFPRKIPNIIRNA